jgi:hypothetical protein
MLKRLLVNFAKSTLIGIAMLVVGVGLFVAGVVLFVVWARVDQLIVERRAQTFCDAFAVGETTSRERVQDLLKDKPHRTLLIFDGSKVFVQFPTHLPQYYSCIVELKDWKVIGKEVQFKD